MKLFSLFASNWRLLLIGLLWLAQCESKRDNSAESSPAGADTARAVLDRLPSWTEGKTKKAIMDFVTDVTTKGDTNFIKKEDRIAVFDNDGTLWAEQPMYFQFLFAIDRIKAMASEHPEWRKKEPFRSVLAGDFKKALAGGENALAELMLTTHAGMTTEQFDQLVKEWIATALHPRFKKPYTSLVYQPMLELLAYLRSNGFKTFIVSGGGVEFMRAWADSIYGIPPEQVIGSSIKLQFDVRDGVPEIIRLPAVNFIDDKEGKPVGIEQQIGRRPAAAFGNSDGDFEMLQWTTAGNGRRLGLLVHHDDSVREWAYDRHSLIGQLSRGLDEAAARGWIVVSMKNDWNKIFQQ